MVGPRKCAGRVLAAAAAAGLLWLSAGAAAAPFTSGNVVVYRTGGSLNPATAAASGLQTTGNPVFLDEYTPAGAWVQSFAMPTTVTGSNQALFGGNGNANNAQEGLLQRSANKYCLAVPGYANSGNTNTRTIARVSGAGTINTTTATTDVGITSIFKGVATNDCNEFWTTSVSDGVRYVAALGATTSSTISASPTAMRALDIYGGQLYVTTNTSPNTGINSFAAALPTATDSPVLLNGFATTNATQPYAFFFAKLNGSTYDTLYVADSGKGIFKFALVGATWTQVGSPIFTTGDAYRGLAGTVSGTTVTLFAVKGGSSTSAAGGGVLVKVVDTAGYNAAFSSTTPTTLATFATNTTFRGVALAPDSPQVTSSVTGANGTISPTGTQAADFGVPSVFTVTPDPGYAANVGGTCGGNLVGSTYTTNPVTANCTVSATFAVAPHTVTSSAAGNGTISPPSQSVQDGATTQFAVTPGAGYHATMGGTCPAGSLVGTTYTTGTITADCNVSATFSINQYSVTSSAGANGSIDPATMQTVNYGSQPAFTVTPNPGYYATVSGTCGGALVDTTYTTNAVTADCTVVANFAALPVVTSTAIGHGQISPSGAQTVAPNSTLQFTVTPDSGYSVVTSGCGGKINGSTFTTAPITADCTVTASFATKNILFVGNSYTFARVDPALTYNFANVNDLTAGFNALYPNGTNSWPWNGNVCTGAPFSDGCFEQHPWGGVPGIFKALIVQAGLDYNVSLSTRNAATLRGHFLNTANAVWDLRSNIASQKWDIVMVQGQSDEPLPANKSKNGDPASFKTYANQIAKYVHQGNGQSTDLVTNEQTIYATEGFGTSNNTTPRTIPPNFNANPAARVYVMQNWSRPDMVEAHKCTVADYSSTDGAPLVDPTCAGNANGSGGNNTVFYTAQPTTALNLNDITTDMNSSLASLVTGNSQFSGVIPTGNAFQKAVDAGVVKTSGFYNASGTYDESGPINLWWLDRTHPSRYGAYVSALVHFARLTGQDPTQFGGGDAVAAGLGIASADAVTFQQMAKAAVVPGAPTAVGAVAGNGQATVTFTAPVNLGGLNITGYTATCGAQSAGGSTSPIVVTGLTNGTAVSCTVVATNSVGDSVPSPASDSVTPKAPQTIDFPQPDGQTYAPAGTFGVAATATSNLDVSFASQTPGVCTVASSTVTIVSAGTCTIRATQPGNAAFTPAPFVDRNIAIAQASQTIVFAAQSPASRTYASGGTFAVNPLGAGGGSGNPVTYSSLSASVCTTGGVNGATVTMHATGTCTLAADQAGDDNHLAAGQVTRDVGILPPTITVAPVSVPASATLLTAYPTQNLSASGAAGPYTFQVTGGALPPGLDLSTAGVLDGTPTAAGAFSFTVTAFDSSTGAEGGPFTGSQSYSVTVAKASANATIGSSVNPSALGQTVVFTAGVTGGTPPPGGSVTFLDGGTAICASATLVGGQAQCSTGALGMGTHTITASYGGDANYDAVVSSPLSQVVDAASANVLTVTLAGSGAGTVSSDSPGIQCGSDCSEPYESPTQVTLTATPEGGSLFAGWLGACTGTAACVVTVNGATAVSATFAPAAAAPLRIDVDGNNSYDALTDGLITLRYLFGLTGTSLTNGATGTGATLTDPDLMLAHLNDIRPLFDIDGNGQADALTDGLLVIRYLFGLRGNALIVNAVGTGATRVTALDIETYLKSILP